MIVIAFINLVVKKSAFINVSAILRVLRAFVVPKSNRSKTSRDRPVGRTDGGDQAREQAEQDRDQ